MHIKIKQGRRNMNLEPVSTNKNKKIVIMQMNKRQYKQLNRTSYYKQKIKQVKINTKIKLISTTKKQNQLIQTRI